MYEEKEKAKVIFKMGDRKLIFNIDLDCDIYSVLGDIAEQMTFFTFTTGSCEKAKETIKNITRNEQKSII